MSGWELESPSENGPVGTFGAVDKSLYNAIVNMGVQPGKMCMSEMMSVDARGGLGLAGIDNLLPLEYDKYARRGSTIFGTRPRPVAGLCAIPPDETSVDRKSTRLNSSH